MWGWAVGEGAHVRGGRGQPVWVREGPGLQECGWAILVLKGGGAGGGRRSWVGGGGIPHRLTACGRWDIHASLAVRAGGGQRDHGAGVRSGMALGGAGLGNQTGVTGPMWWASPAQTGLWRRGLLRARGPSRGQVSILQPIFSLCGWACRCRGPPCASGLDLLGKALYLVHIRRGFVRQLLPNSGHQAPAHVRCSA